MHPLSIQEIFQIVRKCNVDEVFLFDSNNELNLDNFIKINPEISEIFRITGPKSKKIVICSSSSFYDLLTHFFRQDHIGTNIVFITIEEYLKETLPVTVDVRYAAHAALLPIFEPSTIREFIDLVTKVFSFGLVYSTSVVIRLIDHAIIEFNKYESDILKENNIQEIQIQNGAIGNKWQLYKQLASDAYISTFNELIDAEDKTLGIISCGVTFDLFEKLNRERHIPYPILKINQYPLSRQLVGQVYDYCDEVIVFENGRPFVEEQIRGIMGRGTQVRGKLDQIIPMDTPLTIDLIREIIGL